MKSISSEPIIFLYATVYMINLSILPQLVLQKVCLKEIHDGISQNSTTTSITTTQETRESLCITNIDDAMSSEAKKVLITHMLVLLLVDKFSWGIIFTNFAVTHQNIKIVQFVKFYLKFTEIFKYHYQCFITSIPTGKFLKYGSLRLRTQLF